MFMEKAQGLAWYAVRVRSNHERTTLKSLNGKGYEQFAPFYKSKARRFGQAGETELPLFPGYVFCRFDSNRRLPILQTPGVVSVVGFGNGPVPVDDKEIANLRAVVTNGRDPSPWPFLRVGQKVRVVTGPLQGVEGLLVDVRNGRRIVVCVNLLQRSVAAEIEADCVDCHDSSS